MENWAGWLEELLRSTDAQTITNYVLYVIAGLFACSLVLLSFRIWRTFTNSTPALLTSIGIFGTFTGVVIGLLDFEPKNIDASIELLLAGLKTAFITSLAGMAAAIVYRILGTVIPYTLAPVLTWPFRQFFRLFKKKSGVSVGENVEPKDILNALLSQEKHLIGINEAVIGQERYFEGLKRAISGEEESSLAGQLKLMRSDAGDHHRENKRIFENFSIKLWEDLANVSKVIAESATSQIIDALKDAITNFNTELREQFGENFKALDASVEKLVTWQANYGKQVEQMTLQYEQGVKAITDVKNSVVSISNETKSIPETMLKLQEVLQVNQHQIQELSRHLAAFKSMRDEAVSAVPEMQKHVEKTVDDITKASQKASQGYQLLVDNTETVQRSFIEKVGTLQQQLESTVNQLVEKQIQEMNRSFRALEDEVSRSVDLSGKALNKHVEMIDESLSKEISKVMNHMGQGLGSISGQFTKDYQILTREMKRVVSAGGV